MHLVDVYQIKLVYVLWTVDIDIHYVIKFVEWAII